MTDGKSESNHKESYGPAFKTRRELCKEAMRFKCTITFSFRELTANAKSVFERAQRLRQCGDVIEFTCDGEDENEALKAIVEAVESGLGRVIKEMK